jgi:hypothetical protein
LKFCEYIKNIYQYNTVSTSQSSFLGKLFTAAGSNFFVINPNYNTDSYQNKICNGSKPLSKDIKASFPRPIEKDKLTNFFDNCIGNKSVSKLMKDFKIDTKPPISKVAFLTALSIQFESFIIEEDEEVEDIIGIQYSNLLSGNSTYIPLPLYPKDNCAFIGGQEISKSDSTFYDRFSVTYTIVNTGSVVWENRYIEAVGCKHLKVEDKRKDIGILKPKDQSTITFNIYIRGIEGVAEAVFDLKDSSGQICFPDKRAQMKLVSDVINTAVPSYANA